MARLIFSYRDYSREMSSMELLIADPSAGGADFDATIAKQATLVTALAAITNAVLGKQGMYINESKEVGDAPAGTKRELGLRVFWADTTAETVGHFTIPAPDPTGAWLILGTDDVDLTETDVAALITALEANCLSPDGNAITISRITEVGRRN